MRTRSDRQEVRFPGRGITRLRSRSSELDRVGRIFGERMREAFDRLRADPVAWQDYVDEVASMTLVVDRTAFR